MAGRPTTSAPNISSRLCERGRCASPFANRSIHLGMDSVTRALLVFLDAPCVERLTAPGVPNRCSCSYSRPENLFGKRLEHLEREGIVPESPRKCTDA